MRHTALANISIMLSLWIFQPPFSSGCTARHAALANQHDKFVDIPATILSRLHDTAYGVSKLPILLSWWILQPPFSACCAARHTALASFSIMLSLWIFHPQQAAQPGTARRGGWAVGCRLLEAVRPTSLASICQPPCRSAAGGGLGVGASCQRVSLTRWWPGLSSLGRPWP